MHDDMTAGSPEREASGTWWDPQRPDLKIFGRLTFGGTVPQLVLEGAFPEEMGDEVALPRTLHGECFSRPFTLHRVISTETTQRRDEWRATYRVQTVVEGCHIDPAAKSVERVLVRFAGLERWISDRVFRHDIPPEDFGTDVVTYKPAPSREVSVSGETPGVLKIWSNSVLQGTGVGSRVLTIQHSAQLVFIAADAMTLDHATSAIVFPLKQVMSMLLDTAAIEESVSVRLAGDDEMHEGHPLHDERITPDAEDPLGSRLDFLKLPDAGLEVMASWLELAPRYSEVAALATEALHGHLPIQSSLIAATAAAEGLHRLLMPDDRLLGRTESRTLRKKLVEAAGAEHRDVVLNTLSSLGEVSLRTRLAHLAESLGPAMTQLVTDPDAFGVRLAWFRNRHAHLLDNEAPPLANPAKEDAEWIAQVTLTRICARVVVAKLLTLCACDATVLGNALRASADVQSWKSQARELMPEVVAPGPQDMI
ncbi:HEPN domain-containing protein [Blastococcus xanthinilyticus]|uniref:Uncharacterized protein n=1 Tax=Blastococcus xanthinilyticus TaxID=1564164 RepID=A0A5S5D193_9ACTN|nr:HEPN domain-containing protein [Blastococcus xanthinilyticus]TYP88542.1 hypothetical protein BD833_104250 [Blastococcus xanthinilyticus]